MSPPQQADRLPAIEQFGEGIFVTFEKDAIGEWLKRDGTRGRQDELMAVAAPSPASPSRPFADFAHRTLGPLQRGAAPRRPQRTLLSALWSAGFDQGLVSLADNGVMLAGPPNRCLCSATASRLSRLASRKSQDASRAPSEGATSRQPPTCCRGKDSHHQYS